MLLGLAYNNNHAAMTAAPLLLDIKANALDDGPGIRSVVFFKGCPLACVWCHNPESQACGVELAFDSSVCIGCRACLSACPQGALTSGQALHLERRDCTRCLACVDVCPSGALSRVGTPVDLDALLATLLKDQPFYVASGGGVTLSGGEPTLHLTTLEPLLRRLQQAGIHTLLQTCGLFHRERFLRQLHPWLDLIHFDLKLADDAAHRRYCGQGNTTILANFLALKAAERQGGARVLARIALIPGLTDTEANLGAFAAFFRENGVTEVQLLDYNPLWPTKLAPLGRPGPAADSPLRHWPARDQRQRAAAPFHAAGIAVVTA